MVYRSGLLTNSVRHDPSSQECHLVEIPDFEDPTPADNKDSGSNTEMLPIDLVPTTNQAQRGVFLIVLFTRVLHSCGFSL